MQRGHIYQSHGAWFLRFYEGSRRVSKRLGSLDDYSKRAVEPLAQEILRGVNRSTDAGMTLDDFIEFVYLPHVKEHLRRSTSENARSLWRAHVTGRPEARKPLHTYRTVDCQAILNLVARENDLTKTTLQRVKAFLSGVFRHAALSGIREGNPVRECVIPARSRPKGETYAYSLDEIRRTLAVLPLLPKAAVAIAALAGLRLGELHGLEWIDYDGSDLSISRSVWRGEANPAKSKASKNYVPVIPALRAILDEYRATTKEPRMFPIDLINIHRRQIAPRMRSIGLVWHGWHAFRRGIASNLFELGCDDLTVQRVLRHSEVQVTRESYIKVRDPKLDQAMDRLSEAFGQQTGSKKAVTH